MAIELAGNAGRPVKGNEKIIKSSIVFYAWNTVAQALEKSGAVTQEDGLLATQIDQVADLIECSAR